MNLSTYVKLVRREARGARGRLAFFTVCLAIGVAAVVAVAGLSQSLDQTIQSQARQLLAADIVIKSTRPIPDSIEPVLVTVPRVERVLARELATVVAARGVDGEPGRSALVALKAVDGGYPLYGELRLEPAKPLAELLDPEGVVVSPELLGQLHIATGDALRVGNAEFHIRGTVVKEPDRLPISVGLASRVFISKAGLSRAGLEQFGSRIENRLMLKLPDGSPHREVQALARRLSAALPLGRLVRRRLVLGRAIGAARRVAARREVSRSCRVAVAADRRDWRGADRSRVDRQPARRDRDLTLLGCAAS